MTTEKIAILILAGTSFSLFLLLLINAIHIYRAHYPEISKQIDGEHFDSGFLFAANRFMHWGHFCISRSRAKKFGVNEIFNRLPKSTRFQLIFHWAGVLTAVILLGSGWWLTQSAS